MANDVAATFARTGWTGAFNRYRAMAFDGEASADIVGATVDRPSCFIAGAGHWVQHEAPAEVNQALDAFLDSI